MSAVRRKMTTFDGMIRTLNVLLSFQLAEKLRRHRFFFEVSHRSIKWQSRSFVVTKRYSYSTSTKKVNGLVSYYDEWPLGKDDDAYYSYTVEQSLLMTLTCSYYYMCFVCVCFLPIHSGHHQVRWTYQPESHGRKVTQDFSPTFFLRCVP